MTSSRRDFLHSAGSTLGALSLPSWVFEAEAAVDAKLASNKDQLADVSLSTARKLGASYADLRINRYRTESIATREQQVQSVARNQSYGFGVRVLVRGAWGFAASNVVTAEEVKRVTGQAVETARVNSAFQRKPVMLVPTPKVVTSWKSSFERDPFDVSLDDKIQFLLKLNEAAMKAQGVSFAT